MNRSYVNLISVSQGSRLSSTLINQLGLDTKYKILYTHTLKFYMNLMLLFTIIRGVRHTETRASAALRAASMGVSP